MSPMSLSAESIPQRVPAAVEAQLAQILNNFVFRPVTPELLDPIRDSVMNLLISLQRGGDIPADVNVRCVRVSAREHDPSAVHIDLPVLLRLYLQDGVKSARTARFENRTSCCHFLGHGLGRDLYYCDQGSLAPTVIARASSAPADYESGMSAARMTPVIEPLGLAFALAVEAGLVDG